MIRPTPDSRPLCLLATTLACAGATICLGNLIADDSNSTDSTTVAAVDDGFEVRPQDWPWWRGPARNGTAPASQNPPTEFSDNENVLWTVDVPGRGHGSPTIVGHRIFIAVSDEAVDSQSVQCFERDTGELLWSKTIHESGGMRRNKRATCASSTIACDGERIFVNFPNADALLTTALSLSGEQLWQRRISSYVVHQGYGASPALYRNLVIVSADNKGGGAIAALDRATGEVVWERKRPVKPNYPSPTLLHVDGKDQLVMVGCDQIVSYDPLTGKTLWETDGATTECVTSTLTDGKHIYTSGGYPENHMSAIRADGSAELVWKNSSRLYVPSLVIHGGYLYGVLDAGIATCWKADSGKEMWKKRLGGNFSSSPVLVGDRIYVTSESGEFFIFRANPEEYQEIARNQLGNEAFATPTIVDSRIYHRVAYLDESGNRQEKLVCVGK